MSTSVIKNVQTRAVGFAPIPRRYFDQCGIQRIIDDHVDLDPRRKILTHGEATVAMITTDFRVTFPYNSQYQIYQQDH